jgi:hypothetical protein
MVAIARSVGTFSAMIVVAGLVGYFAGRQGANIHVQAASVETVRASRFELVNGSGTVVATWEAGQGNEAHLRFLPSAGNARIEIGVLSDGHPLVQMAGRDGKRRIVMELDQYDKPMLGMGDERWEGRVLLGFVEPDTYAPEWDNWGLMFRPFGSEKPSASIGVLKMGRSTPEGVLTLSGKRIR